MIRNPFPTVYVTVGKGFRVITLLRIAIVTALAGLVAGCSGASVLNAVSSQRGVDVKRGIAYGSLPRQQYDLYRPSHGPAKAVIVFLYGGGWDSGERASYEFVGNALAKRGYAVAIPDYRLYPQVRFPAFVEDAAKAVAAVRRDVAGGGTVVLMGHSAGAHIGALVDLDPRYLAAEGTSPCRAISAFVGLAGPYDFLPIKEEPYLGIFPAGLRKQSQPIEFAAGRHPPSLLIHGTSDKTVAPKNSVALGKALRSAGNDAEVKLYDGIGHAELVGTMGPVLRLLAPTLDDVDAFVSAHAGGRAC